MDDELLQYAKRGIAREHGLAERDAHRLVGETAAELHADARAMTKELGIRDPSERIRDEGGHFASSDFDMNRLIREKAGR